MNAPDPITGTTLPEQRALDAIMGCDGPARVRLIRDLLQLIQASEFPRLTLADDDGLPGLLCPLCHEFVRPEHLAAVDRAERWTTADAFDFDLMESEIVYDGWPDWDGTGYYLHLECGGAVDLPDDWKESAS